MNHTSRRPAFLLLAATAALAGAALLLFAPADAQLPPSAPAVSTPGPTNADPIAVEPLQRHTDPAALDTVRNYRLQATTALGLHDGTGLVTTTFAGGLATRTIASRDGERIDAWQLTGTSADADLARDLAQPIFVRTADDGRLLGVRWPAMRASSCQWFAAILAAVHATRRAEPLYELDERDTSGTARVRYTLQRDGSLCRERLRYVADASAPVPDVVQSHGVIRFAADTADLNDLTYDEVLELAIPEAGKRLRHELHVRCTFGTETAADASTRPECDWDGAWWTFGDEHELAAAELRANHAAFRQQAVRGVTTAEVLAALQALVASGTLEGGALHHEVDRLARLIEGSDRVVAELRHLLAGMDAQNAALVCSALGAAGTTAARELLAHVAGDAAGDPALRYAAVQSMFQLDGTDPATERCLVALLHDPNSLPAMRGITALVVGSFAGASKGEARAALWQQLLAVEPQAIGPELVDWFEALGNVGAAEAVPVVARYLDHGSPEVRQLALVALRRAPAAAVVPFLCERATHDADPAVRFAAVEILATHGAVPMARAALQRLAAGDPDPAVRQRAQQAG